jgi:hypothetical protein
VATGTIDDPTGMVIGGLTTVVGTNIGDTGASGAIGDATGTMIGLLATVVGTIGDTGASTTTGGPTGKIIGLSTGADDGTPFETNKVY